MVTVVRSSDLVIDSESKALDYLVTVAVRPRTPFARGTSVNIMSRTSLPTNVAVFNVGIVVECPDGVDVCWVFVMNNDGDTAVIAIPKSSLVART